jgi:hypothetical protein
MNKISILKKILIVALLSSIAFLACAESKSIPSIMPPASKVHGLTYGEWLAKWWQYALELPADKNPISGETGSNCVYRRIGNVELVLANSTLSEAIDCEIPSGMMMFIEVLGAECSTMEEAPFFGGNDEELIACARTLVPQDLAVSIDDVDIKDLSKYFSISPVYSVREPENNILGVPGGTEGTSVGSGVYIMVPPLNIGSHTIHVRGSYPDMQYTADKTFNITVKKMTSHAKKLINFKISQ